MAKLFQFIEVLFSTLLLHGQKVLAQDQKNPFDFSCWEKTCNSWNVKTFNFVYFALNQTENLLELKERKEGVMVKSDFSEMKLDSYKPLLYFISNPFPQVQQKVFYIWTSTSVLLTSEILI